MSFNQEERWLLEEKYEGEKTEGFFTDLKRLEAGEPLAYIIGHVPFLGLNVFLDSKPLIPRLETEFWGNLAIKEINKVGAATPRPLHILDLCSGSGAIGLAVTRHCTDSLVTLSDITNAHNSTVNRTISENGIDQSRVTIVTGDLFEKISGSFDFILTNPPYIDPALDRAEVSVKTHEPHLALYGGKDGLDIILTIINDSKKHLEPGGQLWIEHEPEQTEAIQKSAEAAGFRAVTHFDQYGVLRFSVLVR